MKKFGFLIVVIGFFSLFYSCKVNYSLTGASIPQQAKTFSVKYFQNNASLVQPALSQKLTDKLKDRLLTQTSLNMINSGGDIAFEGEITDYFLQPVAIQGNETAQLTQLTVKINVRFFNSVTPDSNFELQFSRFQQFSSTKSLSEVEDALVEQIVDDLVDDIYNKAFVNW